MCNGLHEECPEDEMNGDEIMAKYFPNNKKVYP